ncbi:Dynein heavy chain 6, axonemal, partial [Tetrabaena socialis]
MYGAELNRQVEQMHKQITAISIQAQHDMILDERSDPFVVLAYTGRLLERVQALQTQAERIQLHQRTFRLEETRFPELEDCHEDVALRHRLWTALVEWEELTGGWLVARFEGLAPSAMEGLLSVYSRAVFKMERGLVPNKLLAAREAVTLISTEATQEAALEAMLDKVTDKWRHVELVLKPYKALKETYVMGGVAPPHEVLAVLEDSAVIMATIAASRYVAGIRAEVERLERQLRLFGDTLDEWLDCQRQWLALEPILTAADIQRQLPAEARAFAAVDRQLKDINRKPPPAKDRPTALQAPVLCNDNEKPRTAGTQPGLLEQLRRCNEALEGVAKNLESLGLNA